MKGWLDLRPNVLEKLSSEWEEILENQDSISPDKYLSTLSYFKDLASRPTSTSADVANICKGFFGENGTAEVLIHIVHARPKSEQNGWFKVTSTRLSPKYELELHDEESDYTAKLNETTYFITQCLMHVIDCAKVKGIGKVKYFAGSQVDMKLLYNLSIDISKSDAAQKLGITADRKGQWIELSIE